MPWLEAVGRLTGRGTTPPPTPAAAVAACLETGFGDTELTAAGAAFTGAVVGRAEAASAAPLYPLLSVPEF